MRDIAERAPPGTDVTQNHKGRGAIAETLTKIGATRFFANRIQAALTKDLLQACHLWGARKTRPDPGGFLQSLVTFCRGELNGDPGDLLFGAGASIFTHGVWTSSS